MTALLSTKSLTKRYGNVAVVQDVSVEFRRGEVHALLGPNGAGKSTLCKMIAGLTPITAGELELESTSFAPAGKQDAEQRGVEIVQQELNLINTLSVAENLLLTRLPRRWGVIQRRVLHRQARQILGRFGLSDVQPEASVSSLGVGRQQMVEIAAALARDCKLLILDEPTAALSGHEVDQLLGHLDRMRRQGVGIIYITHRLDEVKQIADRMTILRDGGLITTQPVQGVSTDQMVRLMSGQQTASVSKRRDLRRQSEAMRVDSLCRGLVREVSFSLRYGERLGVTGLVGSGRTELLRAIFGADRCESGRVDVASVSNNSVFRHPRDAVRAGLAMVTEDRKHNGLLLSQSICVNTSIASMGVRFSRFGLRVNHQEREIAVQQCELMETRCESIDQLVGTLSGGNQQKVAVSKWLVRDANVFLFDEPTRGIDVASRRRIYRLFESLAESGKAMLIVSSDLDELFETCDRILVMSAGRVTANLSRGEWSEAKILQASFAGYSHSIDPLAAREDGAQ
ncbi:MAG: sugar ABC transporter ATP-binding protein [Planctomycetota bacterium]